MPELGLCPTPRRASDVSERRSLPFNEVPENESQENNIATVENVEPLPKKRKLQRKRSRWHYTKFYSELTFYYKTCSKVRSAKLFL